MPTPSESRMPGRAHCPPCHVCRRTTTRWSPAQPLVGQCLTCGWTWEDGQPEGMGSHDWRILAVMAGYPYDFPSPEQFATLKALVKGLREALPGCCPVCQELLCDPDCPLALLGIRPDCNTPPEPWRPPVDALWMGLATKPPEEDDDPS